MKNILVNWKTTLAGVIVFVVAGLVAIGKLTTAEGGSIIGFLTAVGLIAAKDSNVHGIGSNATTDPTKP